MPKILLVDDDIAEISAVKRVIARAGHQVVLATGSEDALAAIVRSSPTLVLVGATCEGGEALRRFAAAEEARGIPIVVLGESANAAALGPQLPRPLDPEQLAEQLAASLAGALAARVPAAPAQDGSSRKAAADALRARAEELRRGAATGGAVAPRAPAAASASGPHPPAKRNAPAAAAPPTSPDPDDPGLEAILRRAEEAERAHAARANGGQHGDAGRAPADRIAPAERPRAAAEQRARQARADIHADIEGELARLERQLADERQSARGEAQRVASERAAAAMRGQEADARRRDREDAQRRQGEDARRRADDEEQLRAAIESARVEMEALRRKSEDESRRRAQAEAEVARLGREAERRAANAAAQPAPFDLPVYRPPTAEPAPDPGEEAARRRVAALRERTPAPRAEPGPPAVEVAPAAGDAALAPPVPVRPPPPELRAGALADLPAPRLLALAARSEVSGRIDFEGEAARSIYLEDGAVVGATSSDPRERVEELALRLGLVTREQHRQVASGAAPLATRRAALVLLERGFLKPTELTGLVRRRTEEVVFGVFADAGARFRWSAAEVPADERTALDRTTLALSVEGVRRRWLAPQVDAVLGGAGTLLSPVGTGPTAAELALTGEERRAVALADGLRTLDEILAASPLDPLSTRQALAALVLVGALAVRTFQGGRPAAAATAAIDLGRVSEKLDQVRRADYFTVLGVGRLCTPHEVRDAFERLRAEFDPGRFQGIRAEGLDVRLDEIRAVVADARDVLADDRLRDEYLRGLGE